LNEELKVYVTESTPLSGHQKNQGSKNDSRALIVSANLKLTDYVKLDNGSAFLGFTHETVNLTNIVSIDNWTFVSEARSNQ
jgi:hypothetical protein